MSAALAKIANSVPGLNAAQVSYQVISVVKNLIESAKNRKDSQLLIESAVYLMQELDSTEQRDLFELIKVTMNEGLMEKYIDLKTKVLETKSELALKAYTDSSNHIRGIK